MRYTSNEQYFQHEKAIAEGNFEIAAQIMATDDPVEQNSLGQKCSFTDADWSSMEAMERGAIAKFSQNKRLLDYLKGTIGLHIIHANLHNHYWASGTSLNDKDVLTKSPVGENKLGCLLMRLRDDNLINMTPNSNPRGHIKLPGYLKKPKRQPNVPRDMQLNSMLSFKDLSVLGDEQLMDTQPIIEDKGAYGGVS